MVHGGVCGWLEAGEEDQAARTRDLMLFLPRGLLCKKSFEARGLRLKTLIAK